MRVLVTGSALGVGRAVALRLGRAGHQVAVHYRSSEGPAAEVARDIEERGGSAVLVSGDVTVPEQVEAMAESVRQGLGGLDALINNVGGFLIKDYDELTIEDWDQQLASTVSATFYVSRAMRDMVRDGGGSIVNLSDSNADRIVARPRTLPYSIGKTGILILTRTMAVTEAPYGVNVNAILPGVIENSDPLPDPSKIPAGRHGTFDDIGAAVDFLLSEEARYITGSFVQVGGGWNV